MRKHVVLIITSVLLILMSLSCAYAQDPGTDQVQNNSSVEIPEQNSSSDDSGQMNETTISGTVKDCISKNPFPGVNITLKDNDKVIASTTTKADGSYFITFLSNHSNFNVTASHVGHYSVTKELTLYHLNGSQQWGTVNFELGNTIYVNGNTGNDGWDGTSPTHTSGNIGPKKTIKSGISASKSGGILSIAAGTYKGSDNRHLTINSMNLTIIGNGTSGPGNTTIDPEQNDLVFLISSGSSSNVIIQNIVFTGGEAHGTVDGDDGDDGGAIYNQGKLTINNCLFINNHARNGDNANAGTGHAGHGGDGGAIYNLGTLTVTNSNFENNHAGSGGNASDIHDGDYGGSGGAIFNYGTATITNCSFTDNYAGDGGNAHEGAKSASGGHGGAIYNKATLTINDCIFDGNYAGNGGGSSGICDGSNGGDGGAIYNSGTLLTLQNSNFTSNHAGEGGSTQKGSEHVGGNGGNGGAIYNNYNFKINILSSIFDGNYAGNGADGSDIGDASNGGNGGTIYNNGTLTITSSEIKNSYSGYGGDAHGAFDAGSGGNGGAIYNMNNLTIQSCIIHDNNATKGQDPATAGSNPGNGGNGGGIYNIGTLTISDSEIYNNRAGNGGNTGTGPHGAPGGNGGGIYNIGTLTISDSEIRNNYAGNAGSNPGSSIGGSGGGIYNKGSLTILQNSQIHNNSAGKGGDANGENPNGGEGGYGGGIYNEGHLIITGNSTNIVQIYNNNAGLGGVAYSFGSNGGNGGKAGGIYNKNYCNITYANIYSNIGGNGNTYTGNGDHADIDGGDGGNGGAFYNEGTLNLFECSITNNQAGAGYNGIRGGYGGNGGNGGAVYNTGTLNITNCQISNNKAGSAGVGGDEYYYTKWTTTYNGGDGGLGGSGGAIYNTNKLSIARSSIIQNIAGNGGNGGKGAAEGIHNGDGADDIDIENPGDGGNGGNGGGIFNKGTITSIINSIINNNIAGRGGDGGIYTDDIALDLWYKVTPATAGMGGSGGGVYSNGTLNRLENTTINNNNAGNGGNGNPVSRYPGENGGAGGNGGGLVLYNQTPITNCQISNNKAGNGGNGANTYTSSGYNPSTEPGNGGDAGSGGGIYFYYANNTASVIINIQNSTMDNNSAGTGGNGGSDNGNSNQHPSDGGKGGNGGFIAIISKTVPSSPSYSLHLFIEQSTITNNKAGIGGQAYLSGTIGSNGLGGALYSQDNHYFDVAFNRILNNTPQAVYLNLSSINDYTHLYNNWWGSNAEPVNQIAGNNIDPMYYGPWLILSISATPTSLYSNQTSHIIANLTKNSDGDDTYVDWGMYVPNGIFVLFGADTGNMAPSNNFTGNGSSSSIFTPMGGSRISTVSATVDNQTVTLTLNVTGIVDIRVLQYPLYYNTATKRFEDTYICGNTPAFVIQVDNSKYHDDASGIVLEYIIGDGYKYITSTTSGTGSVSYDAASRTITWNIGSLAKGSVDFLKVYVQIIKTGNKTPGLTNTARLKQVTEKDLNATNNQASYGLISPPSADIQVTQTMLNYTNNGTRYVNYIINVANNGPDTATGLKITDKLPSGIQWVSDTSGGTYNSTSGIWTIGTFKYGETVKTLTITGKITGTSTVIKNTAYMSALNENDWNYANNGQSTILVTSGTYAPCADISAYNYPWYYNTATDKSKETYMCGNTPIFVLQANNANSYDDATGVILEYIIGTGFEYIDCYTQDVGTATYNATSRTITWKIGFLPKGGTAFLKVFLEVITTGNKTAALTTTARLKQLDQTDMKSSNNQSSYSIISVGSKGISSAQILYIGSSPANSTVRPDHQKHDSRVPMQNTGLPLPLLALAILMTLAGLSGLRRR